MSEHEQVHEEPWRLERHMGIAPYPHPEHVDDDADAGAGIDRPRFAADAGADERDRRTPPLM